jgi:hypothetical protein
MINNVPENKRDNDALAKEGTICNREHYKNTTLQFNTA